VSRAKVAISIESDTLGQLDRLVEQQFFRNRSQAIQEAVDEKLERLSRRRLAAECAKLDPVFERSLAEEGLLEEVREWPEY
jgi:metal-responsive CopG/Arc/MetJ family transcriptional regulator